MKNSAKYKKKPITLLEWIHDDNHPQIMVTLANGNDQILEVSDFLANGGKFKDLQNVINEYEANK
ncbi:hypothetical protein MA9V2_199 [Chryseobacterium phage MA9V-2]|nr:hypothetical protein MA9V2_199 [Chryseobacterium phage MA9V-2]